MQADHNNIKHQSRVPRDALWKIFRGLNQRKIVLSIGIKELLDSGVHFGHQTKRWNPKMKPFIFDARNGIHIIDLSKTLAQLEAACGVSGRHRSQGRQGRLRRHQKAGAAVRQGHREGMRPVLRHRALARRHAHQFQHHQDRPSSASGKSKRWTRTARSTNYVKQEQAVIRREEARLNKYFDGIRAMDRHPRRDVRRGHQARAQRRGRGAQAEAFPSSRSWTPTAIPTSWIIRSPRTTTPSVPCA